MQAYTVVQASLLQKLLIFFLIGELACSSVPNLPPENIKTTAKSQISAPLTASE